MGEDFSIKGGDDHGLDAWRWDQESEDFIRVENVPDEVKKIIGEAGDAKGMTPDQFERLFDSEAFRNRLARALRWGGRVYGLKSLQVDESDIGYQEAMEVAYRRLLDGPGAYFLKFFSNRDLVDFFILSAWALPFGKAIFDEIAAKKKAAALAQKKPAGPSEGGAVGNADLKMATMEGAANVKA